MRILCRHGHFAFYPKNAEEIGAFSEYFDQELVRVQDFYTFAALENTPDYSLIAKPFLNLPATKTFAGKPWEVMRENGFVYSIDLKMLVPKLSVVGLIDPPLVNYYFVPDTPLIQPGWRNASGQQLMSYDGEYVGSTFELRVLGFSYE